MDLSFVAGLGAGIGVVGAYAWHASLKRKWERERRRGTKDGQGADQEKAQAEDVEGKDVAKDGQGADQEKAQAEDVEGEDVEDNCECPLCCNQFAMIKQLGEGSFGKTWLAKDRSKSGQAGERVALKICRVSDMQELNWLLDEATFLRAVGKHPHTVRLHDSFAHKEKKKHGLDELEVVLVMDFASGGDLKSLIEMLHRNKRYLPENDLLRFIAQLADAIHFIHSKEILQ